MAAFLVVEAAGVSLDCLPDCRLPNPLILRTTWQRWRSCGELDAVMEAGQPAAARMAWECRQLAWQYRQRITDLSLRQRPPKAIDRR